MRPPQQPKPTNCVAPGTPDPCSPHSSPWSSRDRVRSSCLMWHGSAASGLFHGRGQRSLPCLGLTQRAGPAVPSPGKRARMAIRGNTAGQLCQGKWVPVCPPTRTAGPSAPPISHHSASRAWGVCHLCPSPGNQGSPGQGHPPLSPAGSQGKLTSRFVLALRSTLWVLVTAREREMGSVRSLCCGSTPGTWGPGQLGRATPQQDTTRATYTDSR